MRSKTNKLVLNIAILLEDYSEKEILEAISIAKSITFTATPAPRKLANKNKPFSEQTTLVLHDLMDKDEEKYAILLNLDQGLRKKEVLPSLAKLKEVSTQVDKNLSTMKSRNILIPKLITAMAKLPTEEIKLIVESALSNTSTKQSSEYLTLAQFIISGKK